MALAGGYSSGSIDPSKIGVGAGVMSMGNSGVGIEGVSLLLNPAGIVASEKYAMKFNTMYTNLLNGDINYMMLGGIFNTSFGLWGITYLAGNAGSIDLRNAAGVNVGSSAYSNTTIVLSTGAKLSEISWLDWLKLPLNRDALSLGLNLKLFSESATNVSDFSSNGQDLDLGLIYKINSQWTFGMNLQNVLPMSLGGNIHWVNNTDFGVPLNTKLGVTYQYNDKLLLAADMDLRDGMTPLHFGGRYELNEMLDVQLGLDQSVNPGREIVTDLTMGLGLSYEDFMIGYAYHPYAIESANASHYFNICYMLPMTEKRERPVRKAPVAAATSPSGYQQEAIPMDEREIKGEVGEVKQASKNDIHLIQPATPMKVYDDSINTRVLVKSDISNLRINGEAVKAVRGGIAGSLVKLNYGKQAVKVTYDKDGTAYRTDREILRLPKFDDVQEGRWSKDVVEYMSALGLFWGETMPASFLPREALTVKDMGEILAKFKQLKTGAVVDIDQATYDIIALGREIGYPGGLTPRTVVNRALACAVVTKLGNIPVMKVTKSPFIDVEVGKWFIDRVMAAKNAGWISGVNVKGKMFFFPGDNITREAMVNLMRPLVAGEIESLKIQ
jgi:hypothetical protein